VRMMGSVRMVKLRCLDENMMPADVSTCKQ
jgi:hypothetical protein